MWAKPEMRSPIYWLSKPHFSRLITSLTRTLTHTYSEISCVALAQWQQRYNEDNTTRHYKSLEPLVSSSLKAAYINHPNKERLISAIKLGTLCVNSYLQRIRQHASARATALTAPIHRKQFCTLYTAMSSLQPHRQLACTRPSRHNYSHDDL